jgi:hypothetical protein
MKDPHVVTLTYHLRVEPGRTYKNPTPVTVDRPEFAGVLANGIFTVTMVAHFATADEAKDSVDPVLRAWELSAVVGRGHDISFQFDSAEVVDRAPPPPGTVFAHVQGLVSRVTVGSSFSAEVSSPDYPKPPATFVASAIVETLCARYNRWRKGNESLYSMAYFCDTVLRGATDSHKGSTRQEAAKKYAIELEVLRKVGELSSLRGGDLEGRKAGTKVATPSEQDWLQAAISAIILQVGAIDAGSATATLKMTDLPPL